MAMVHTLTSAGARVVTGTAAAAAAAATVTVSPSPPATASALQTPAATNSVHMQQQQQQTLPVLASSCYATASSTASTSTSVAVTTSQHPCHNTSAVAITQSSDGVNGGHVTGDEVMAVAPPETASGATGGAHQQQQQQEEEDDQPVIDIVINNVVAAFSVRCHLDLKYIAMNGDNVEYRRENGMVTMKMRNPYTTASLWSSGKVTCTGATSEDDARVGARRVARYLQRRLHFRTQFANYRVVNVLGTCNMPFAIRIADFSQKYPRLACYEPELHPGVTFRVADIRATLKIFSTGSMTVTAPSVNNVRLAIEHIFPLVHEFRKEKTAVDAIGACGRLAAARRSGGGGPASVRHRHLLDPDEPDDEELDVDEDDCDVDEDDGGGGGGGGRGAGVVQYSNGARQKWPCVPLNGTGSRAAAVSSTSAPPHKRARMALM